MRPSRRTQRPEILEKLTADTDVYDTWTAFLRSAGKGGAAKICNVLAVFAEPLRKDASGSANSGCVPWMTPILGSGCAGQPDAAQLDQLRSIPGRAASSLRDLTLPGGLEAAGLVETFAESLLHQRVPELRSVAFVAVDPEYESEPVDRVTGQCLLAASLIWKGWHETLARSDRMVRRRDALTLPDDARERGDLLMRRLGPAREALQAALEVLTLCPSEMHGMADVLRRLLARVEALIDGKGQSLTGNDVEGLVEVAWLVVITPKGLYPGWRELMTSAALHATLQSDPDGGDRLIDFQRPHPTLSDSGEAGRLTAQLASLSAATRKSWEYWQLAPEDRPKSERGEFFDAVARLLVAQGEYGHVNSPLPTAFVTSMDLEIEMALVSRQQKFTLVLPYHFLYAPSENLEHRAMLFWLAATIDPTKDLDPEAPFDLTKARVTWRPAKEQMLRGIDGVVVVRLVGSPLLPVADEDTPTVDPLTGEAYHPAITLTEDLTEAAAVGAGSRDPKVFSASYPSRLLEPAYLLDEYSGMHQILAAAQGSLPANLVELKPADVFRYWLAVGVQVDDFLVRLVLAAHLDTSTGAGQQLDHHGVMVNRQVSRAEADLLSWHGFDAVQSQYQRMTASIKHYAAHLEYRVPEHPTSRDPEATFRRQCKVGDS